MTAEREREEWRPVVGWEGLYEVSSLGRVRSLDRIVRLMGRWGIHDRHADGKVLRAVQGNGRSQYLAVSLHDNGSHSRHLVHRLVCRAFHGPASDERPDVAHGDGNHANNRADNLRWASKHENMADCVRHGTLAHGLKKPNAKLDPQKVRAIRAATGITQDSLAKLYGVSQSQIWCVKTRRTWRRVSD